MKGGENVKKISICDQLIHEIVVLQYLRRLLNITVHIFFSAPT